jgi:hypothetical protein
MSAADDGDGDDDVRMVEAPVRKRPHEDAWRMFSVRITKLKCAPTEKQRDWQTLLRINKQVAGHQILAEEACAAYVSIAARRPIPIKWLQYIVESIGQLKYNVRAFPFRSLSNMLDDFPASFDVVRGIPFRFLWNGICEWNALSRYDDGYVSLLKRLILASTADVSLRTRTLGPDVYPYGMQTDLVRQMVLHIQVVFSIDTAAILLGEKAFNRTQLTSHKRSQLPITWEQHLHLSDARRVLDSWLHSRNGWARSGLEDASPVKVMALAHAGNAGANDPTITEEKRVILRTATNMCIEVIQHCYGTVTVVTHWHISFLSVFLNGHQHCPVTFKPEPLSDTYPITDRIANAACVNQLRSILTWMVPANYAEKKEQFRSPILAALPIMPYELCDLVSAFLCEVPKKLEDVLLPCDLSWVDALISDKVPMFQPVVPAL